ncbi:MAG: hypothetical protein KDN19_20095 [Verrucomicrobiae bacterium]|nr:hypothetical protein [Verrucomicrobiae bacterium]
MKAEPGFLPRRRWAFAVFFAIVLRGGVAFTEGQSPAPTSPQASPPPGMVTMNLKLGVADLGLVQESLPDMLSPNGDAQMLEQIRMLRITDKPENIEAVRKLIEALNAPVPNVRLVVTSRTVGGSQNNDLFVRPSGRSGGVVLNPGINQTPGVIRQPTINGRPVQNSGGRIVLPKGGVEIGGNSQVGSRDSLVSQSILVRSGGTGVLEVVREVPMVDFFTRLNLTSYLPLVIRGPNRQVVTLVPGGTFEMPEFRWEKAGSELLVKPVVEGNLVNVTVVPRISAIVIANPQALRDRTINSYLTGADQYVEYTSLSTTVTIANGATLTIGGFTKADAGFNRNFWGYGSGSSSSAGSITLKAVIEPPAPPPAGR